jgi:hypothetical protein
METDAEDEKMQGLREPVRALAPVGKVQDTGQTSEGFF